MHDFAKQKANKNCGNILIPKCLFYADEYKRLSPLAKLAYGFLRDRSSLSRRNGERWIDSHGSVYIYFSIKELAERFSCCEDKAGQIMKELEDHKLISRTRQGQGKPYRVVVQDVILTTKIMDSGNGKKCCPDSAKLGRNNTSKKYMYMNNNRTASQRELDQDEILAIRRSLSE